MKINTKEKYNNLKRPLIPKSIARKKEKRKIIETFKLRKLIPFIHEKDRTNKPYNKRFNINPSLLGLEYAFNHPRLANSFYNPNPSMFGLIKHAGEVRQVKKHQRYKKFQMSLKGGVRL